MSQQLPQIPQERKKEKRRQLLKFLPPDLQLKFVPSPKERWFLGGELLKRRRSEELEDKIFVEALKAIEKQDFSRLENLERALKERKKEIAENIEEYLDLKLEAEKIIEICFNESMLDSVVKIVLNIGDIELARRIMEKCFEMGKPDIAGKIALGLNDTESAERAMKECFELHKWDAAGEIALALNNTELAERAMNECFILRQVNKAIKIAIALGKTDVVRNILDEDIKQGALYSATDIIMELGDTALARTAMEECFKKGEPYLAGKLALFLGDTKSAIEAMNRCFKTRQPELAGLIALGLNDPESARRAMKECFRTNKEDKAGLIAIRLGDAKSAKKALRRCFQKDWLTPTSNIAIGLADLGYTKLARNAMKRCFEKECLFPAIEIFAYLVKKFELKPLATKLKEIIEEIREEIIKDNKENDFEIDFGLGVIAHLLKENQELGKFRKEYLPQYLSIKRLAKEINNKIEESKKWKDPQEFFRRYSIDIAGLYSIDLNLANQLLKSIINRGLSFAEAYINLFKPVLKNHEIVEAIRNYIKTNKKLYGHNLSDLLEISSAYLSMKKSKLLIKILNLGIQDFNELKKRLNETLLNKIAQKLGIKAKVKGQEITQWRIKYIGNLVTNQEMIRNKSEYTFEVCNALLKSVFEGRFQDFITNTDQEDQIGRKIAQHNQRVKQEFIKHGINWDNWLKFNERVIMTVGTTKEQNREALFLQLYERINNFQESIPETDSYLTSLKQSLKKDIIRFSQMKKQLDPSKIKLEDLLHTYTRTFNYLKSKNPQFELPLQSQEALGHLIETIKSLTQQQIEQTTEKKFVIKIWDRDPRKDLFQGNFTHCCIAVGVKETPPGGGMTTLYPETIFQYLLDLGINVAEVVDPDTDEPVAQVWLFVTLDNQGKPILVADNFEVNNRYPVGSDINRGIREAMFQFLNRYARACNIERVVLGKVGINDVETNDLRVIFLPPIKKLGGYFEDEEYYLESLKMEKAFDITREIEKSETQNKNEKKITIRELDPQEIDENILQQILNIEEASFPPQMRSNIKDIEETLLSERGIQIVAQNENGEIISYLSSKPLTEAYEQLRSYDPEIESQERVLYVESFATIPEARELSLFLNILRQLLEKAKEKGFKKIAMHARVKNGLSRFLQRKGAKKLRTIENWYNFGEPFDYLEFDLE